MDDLVSTCCFCSKVRDDKNMEVGKGPWVDLSVYAMSRQLPLSHSFVFSHGYCPDCVAHFDERMAAHRSSTVWESLKEAGRRLIAGTGGAQRDVERLLKGRRIRHAHKGSVGLTTRTACHTKPG